MDTFGLIVTTFGGALSAILGVLVGGVVSRRVQERHWLRDKQLQAYDQLFTQYASFMMTIRRGHADRVHYDFDWGAWSAALTSASLVAPLPVAQALDRFGQAINVFLDVVAGHDSASDPASDDELTEASRPAAKAHLDLLNAIRTSLHKGLAPMPFYLGGTLGAHPEGRSH